jgi:hypothetical protein
MSNYQVEPAARPQALTKEALKARRHEQVQGMSRRTLIRPSIGGGMALWLTSATDCGTPQSVNGPIAAGGMGMVPRRAEPTVDACGVNFESHRLVSATCHERGVISAGLGQRSRISAAQARAYACHRVADVRR